MSIGYACLNIGTPNTNIRSVMQRNATPEKLTEVTAHNLEALEKMVDYNIANDIRLYRISSDLIPFGSSPVNALDWPEIHKEAFERIGAKIRKSGMRVFPAPGPIHRPELADGRRRGARHHRSDLPRQNPDRARHRHDQQNRPACRRHLWGQRSGNGSLRRELPAPAGKRPKPPHHRKRRPALQHRGRPRTGEPTPDPGRLRQPAPCH